MDRIGLLYLVVFPVTSVVIGWTLLSLTLRTGLAERWGLRSLSAWRYLAGYGSFACAWLLVVAASVLLFTRAAAVLRDPLLLIATFSTLAWVGCGAYWGLLSWAGEGVLKLPTPLARRAASNALLWNLLLTLPYAFMAMPYTSRL